VFYDAIPFEMLKTYVEKPQVIMFVGDQPAVCHTGCDYMYIDSVGYITGYSYDEITRKVTLQG
jgi:hypothetical protein